MKRLRAQQLAQSIEKSEFNVANKNKEHRILGAVNNRYWLLIKYNLWLRLEKKSAEAYMSC